MFRVSISTIHLTWMLAQNTDKLNLFEWSITLVIFQPKLLRGIYNAVQDILYRASLIMFISNYLFLRLVL